MASITRAAALRICKLSLVCLLGLVSACASDAPSSTIATEVSKAMAPLPILHAEAVAPLVTQLDAMQSALPQFALLQQTGTEVLVERDNGFEAESPIVSSDEVRRISLLQAYLSSDPSLRVRVEGYFDNGAAISEKNLALDRAQALVRALLTVTRIHNEVSAVAAPRSTDMAMQAAIIFVDVNDLGQLQRPLRSSVAELDH